MFTPTFSIELTMRTRFFRIALNKVVSPLLVSIGNVTILPLQQCQCTG